MSTQGNERDVTRRDALGALGVVAGGLALVNDAVAAQDNPANTHECI